MTRADWFLTLLALAGLPFLYLYFWSGAPGHQLSIHGEHTDLVLPLDADRTLRVDGPLGTSIIEISNHRARFLSSPCRNKVCLRGGWLERSGTGLACLPNRISLRILGRERYYDAVNF